MTGIYKERTLKEAKVSKRILVLAALAIAIVALSVVPAFAEGYNGGDTGVGFYTRDLGYFSGPHGGYTTTTNKCQDCHSTHYATGSFKLLRADSREAACDFCHGGGGGSTINIQMDNDYTVDPWAVDKASAEATTTMGKGTGHTLGYAGNAPVDISPAFSDAEGFACFDCHSPHGNSARIMTTFSNPGRALGTDNVVATPAAGNYVGNTSDGLVNANGEWGIDPTYGNFKWWTTGKLVYRPIWPNGRFLLIKDPHKTYTENNIDDIDVTDSADETATAGENKYMISWDEPLGPADGSYGGGQDNDNDNAFPFAPTYVDATKYEAPGDTNNVQGGFLALSEFCTDCHDGAGGASTQPANVWRSFDSAYAVAYSHDAQPRH